MSRSLSIAAVALAAAVLAACRADYGDRSPMERSEVTRRGIDRLAGSAGAGFDRPGCAEAGERLEIAEDTALDPACDWTGGILVETSGVTLDCRGATLSRPVEEAADGPDRVIVIRAVRGEPVRDVRIRNCVVEGGLNGLRITRRNVHDLDPDLQAADAFSGIVVENSRFYGARGSGIFVDAFVSGVTLRGIEVAGAGGAGVYLEAGSRGTTVEDSDIHGNGYGGTGEPARRMGFSYLMAGREGIAVDGSTGNRILRNRIRDNALGGVFLYKNCGEERSRRGWWPRRQGADGNLVEGNDIRGARTAVWIGSRQNENLWQWDCSDPLVAEETTLLGAVRRQFYRDFARNNRIVGNTFAGFDYGIRIEDDGNVVRRNVFVYDDAGSLAGRPAILMQRGPEAGGGDLEGLEIRGNRFRLSAGGAIPDDAAPIGVVREAEGAPQAALPGLTLADNRIEGPGGERRPVDRPAPAPPPPRDPILLVRAVWR